MLTNFVSLRIFLIVTHVLLLCPGSSSSSHVEHHHGHHQHHHKQQHQSVHEHEKHSEHRSISIESVNQNVARVAPGGPAGPLDGETQQGTASPSHHHHHHGSDGRPRERGPEEPPLFSSRPRRGRREANRPPAFPESVYVVSVPEERSKGYVITTLTATDPEAGDVSYHLSAIVDARSQSMFTIDPDSGVVTTTTVLDREFMDVHFLRITATDNGLPPRSGSTTLQINVQDTNDHPPQFEQVSYRASVRESVPSGTTVLTVRAMDQDTGSNADIQYTILNPTGSNEVFRIDSNSGVISTRGHLDREAVSSYTLNVQASDLGPLTTRKSTETSVHISVVDENDSIPQFTNRSYTASVREDINYSKHPSIATVTATDADEGLNAAIRYSIIGGNTQNAFQIDSISGEVAVTGPLDYETTRTFRLIVRAQDAGSPPRSNTTQLLVNVVDCNDNYPKFYSSLFQETVMENTEAKHKVLRVQAYDADDGQNAALTYSIKDGHLLSQMPFSVDSETGWIVTTRELDWEEANLYEFSVVATDHGEPPKTATASIIIRVTDVNDNYPVFEPKTYEVSVSEIDPPGTPVITVTATDQDENSKLNFHFLSGNERGKFNIISQNNQGIISIAQPLDYKADKRYVLSVVASDSAKTDTAVVYINVTDANTHRPVIEKTPYSALIAEDAAIGTTVLVIEATDADDGENARITFTMDDVPEFKIDPVSGAITTTKKLDRETTAGYTIVVTAMDNGTPSLADTTNVEIEVTDINDQSPIFEQESYSVSISEDTPIGTSVMQLRSADSDLGLNGQVRYSFAPGQDGDGCFIVDPNSGIIRTNRVLDRESVAKYELVAQAIDRGTPPMTSNVDITVNLLDVNDNFPKFESEILRFYVPENSPIGYVVGEIKANDPDEGANARIEYSIFGGPDAASFSLITRPGDKAELVTRTEMDFESDKKKYVILLRASSPPLRSDVEVEILVQDQNDNAPILNDFAIVFNNYKNHFPLNSIGKVPAFDADIADQLDFKFVSGNKANLLELDGTSGQVRLSPNLNTNVPTRAQFEVSVFDGINEATAQCQLIVNLVTEAMLFNSVTIRLNHISQRGFLSRLFDRFIEGLAAVVPTAKENIVVFNVQDDQAEEDNLNIVKVSFSVRLSDERDLDSFYSPQFLQERIYLSRTVLTKATGLEVLPFDDNLCVREPCLNFEQCLSVLKFGNASDFVATDVILFRPIIPVNTFACRCPAGFSGMYHKYDCDAEVNLCYSNPCLNQGTCQRRESDYVCLCRDGFAGKNCQVNMATDSCPARMGSNICQGNSKCVQGQQNDKGHNSRPLAGSGLHCANCTFADWSSPLCELRTRSFSTGSYLTFPALRQRHRFNLRLKFATRHDNALLLYNGRYNEKHDFISLEIVDSKLVFSFSLGSVVTTVSLSPPDGYLTNGDWHWVEVNYLNRTAQIKVDKCDEAVQRTMAKNQLEVGSFPCFNSSHHALEGRCNDRMQSCYRFLDLTGPLQIGGLPPLPTKFQTTTEHFIGCISDLHIDHGLVDFDSFVANNGTQAGCLDKRGFCHSYPCKNGGTCREGWGKFVCECKGGYHGQDCGERTEFVKNFRGDSYLVFSPRLQPISLPWMVKVAFKTYQANGLIMKIQLGPSSKIYIEVVNGRLRYIYNLQSVVIQDAKVNDGKWHFVEANWMANGIWLNLDYGLHEGNRDFDADIRGMFVSKVTVGGLEPIESEEMTLGVGEHMPPSFIGCMQDLDVGSGKDAWTRITAESNVVDGCDYPNLCLSDPCPRNSHCIDKGLAGFECKCHQGYIGRDCIPVCEMNACAANALCVPNNASRGYSCDCDDHHTGFYCEETIAQTCPSNWWGYPICGPCQCDTSKGYDGNCNKSTGECMCEANHYQLSDSDICYDCACYSVGSYSNKCDSTSGQCQCRPGVIGRQCDSCGSPFAEVTFNGCEVVYDGCPKNFADAIWWERTKFGSKATQACPKGSTGKASRPCDENGGWLKGDLFDCLSKSFTELSDQLLVIERDKVPLTTYLAIKISQDLKAAINGTKQLYGSDIFVAFKLIHHLLTHEAKQSGLNLTHKQDKYFLPNVVAIMDSIVHIEYAEQWKRIGDMVAEGGPEHLIRLLQKYGQVLIDNREDTFTEPFEYSTQNVVIGLDTISTNELWDMAYIESLGVNRSADMSRIVQSAAASFVDTSLPTGEVGPAVSLPKYNNYPLRRHHEDEITRLVVPLRTIGVLTAPEALEAAHVASSSLQRRNQPKPSAVYFYAIFTTLGQLLPDQYDHSIRYRIGMPLKANTPLFTFVMKPANSSSWQSVPVSSALSSSSSFASSSSLSPSSPSPSSSVSSAQSSPSSSSSSSSALAASFLSKQLNPKIHFRLRTLMAEGRNNPRCAYWTFDNANSNNRRYPSSGNGHHGRGRWSSKGCEVKGVYPVNRLFTSYEYVNCSCDRIAPVTVLMDIAPSLVAFEENFVQSVASYVGLISSIIVLMITFFVLTIIRGLSTNSNNIHRNIVICLMVSQILFLIGLKLRDQLVQREFPCKMLAIFLHYFYMCIFSWLFVEGIHLHRMLTEIRDINHGPMRFYYFLGYAVPAIVVSLAVGVRAEAYGGLAFCWLSMYDGVIWSMIGPICLIATLNIIVFTMALRASVQIKETISDYGNLRTLLWLSIIFLPILGCHWILAILAVNDSLQHLYYGFYLVSFVSAVYTFVGYCLINRRVRYNIKMAWWRLNGKKVPFMDDSQSQTRLSVASKTALTPHFDGLHNLYLYGITTSSTTSRSTATKASSGTVKANMNLGMNIGMNIDHNGHSRRNRKRRRRRRRAEYEVDTKPSVLDLASSHSSDDDEDDEDGQLSDGDIVAPGDHHDIVGHDVDQLTIEHGMHEVDPNDISPDVNTEYVANDNYDIPSQGRDSASSAAKDKPIFI